VVPTVGGDMHNTLIGLPEIEGRHRGVNIAQCILDVIKEYGIGEKTGYLQMDSASNNTTAVNELHPLLVSNFGDKGGAIKPSERRLRCFGHLLNLSTNHLLYGEDPDAFESENANADDDKALEEEGFGRQIAQLPGLRKTVTAMTTDVSLHPTRTLPPSAFHLAELSQRHKVELGFLDDQRCVESS